MRIEVPSPSSSKSKHRWRSLTQFLLAMTCAGCGGTLGPIVTDVQWGAGGELLVTRCVLEVQAVGNMTTYKMHGCKRTVQAGPGASASAAAVPAPSTSSATVAH